VFSKRIERVQLSHHWKLNQSEVAISGRLANQKPGKRTNQKAGYKKKQPIYSIDMSRKSKSKDQSKALNIPFTLTQGGSGTGSLSSNVRQRPNENVQMYS
jgi:hypothetical protein